jgi:hypothetical protein
VPAQEHAQDAGSGGAIAEGPHARGGPQLAHAASPHTTATPSGPYSNTPLKWSGGQVQSYTKTYAIFWLPAGYTYENWSGGSNSRYISLMERYLADIGGSTFMNPMTQYYDTSWISNSSTFTDAALDTSPYPVHSGSVYTTDSDIQAEVARWIKARGWYYGLHEQFFVYTASGVLTYDAAVGGWSNHGESSYCAYHSSVSGTTVGLGNYPIVYANMPDQDGHYNCYAHVGGTYYSPNHDYTADSMLSLSSHEQFETITDPEISAWKDEQGWEEGDKCSYSYGSLASDGGNVTLNGHRYILQGTFSNEVLTSTGNGCTWYRAYPLR